MQSSITTIFTDIGGVLLTNGWDHNARQIAVEKFNLNAAEFDDRHHLAFDIFESGRMSLDLYLDYIVFYEPRNFSKEEFKNFMYSYSQPYNDMLAMYRTLKKKYNLKIVVVSNEGRELNEYRIKKFALNDFVDFFVSSSFVYLRKPDKEIFKRALDLAQSPVEQSIYVDDRRLFVEVAATFGLKGIIHTNYETTKAEFEKHGLAL